jgi:tetratricopeptide (TPR) repeat protein
MAKFMSQTLAADRPRTKSTRLEAELPTSTAYRLADYGLIVAFLSLTFLLGVFPLQDTDFWWHLKTGDIIRQTGQVPTFDTYTYGAEGHPWIDLHWIFQVLLSWGYSHIGVVGLNLGKCAITTFAVFLLISARRREWPVWVVLLAWLPGLLVLSGRMYIRPETISLLYLAIVLAILFRWDRKPWLAFGLPLVQVCWVNTQGLFMLEPILIGFALADAVVRPGAFSKERRGWWRLVGLATALTGVACFINPYGLAGVLYPIQLASTMNDPIFKNSIGELKPLLKFMGEVGFDSLPLQLHLSAFALGFASFFIPAGWRIWVALADRGQKSEPPGELPKGRKKRETSRGRKKAEEELAIAADSWRISPFRALMFAAFSVLSLAATRNSHQFAAVVGTVTAWNFAEWAWAIRARKLRLDPTVRPSGPWPRVVAFAAIALTFACVASGRLYAWSGEGRTVGLGEAPLWFPREAVKFAGGPGMPNRLLGFHNGHPSLYEYYWAPAKKAYTDARLEVMGPELYKKYLDLSDKIAQDKQGWAQDLDRMGRPVVLVDNLFQTNSPVSATLLTSRHWRCVWFDPVVSLFVHESYAEVVENHTVNFAARHFRHESDVSSNDPATLAASSRALRYIGTQCRARAGNDAVAQALFLVGLDDARRLQTIEPGNLNGWKQAGLIEHLRGLLITEDTIPRFRLPFDPVFDLSPARSTYDLNRALEIDPKDGYTQYYLARSFLAREMDEPAVPLLEKFVRQPHTNLTQQAEKTKAAGQLALLHAKLGATPTTHWANLSELDRVVASLMATGRASTLADVMESAYRPEVRPWEWADRLAVLRLHLGEPAKARATWLAATANAPPATRMARIAATYLVEGDFETSRKCFREAIAADPNSFEAHYGLACLELDAARATEATEQARLAEKAATTPHARSAARAIVETASPYAAKASDKALKPQASK